MSGYGEYFCKQSKFWLNKNDFIRLLVSQWDFEA